MKRYPSEAETRAPEDSGPLRFAVADPPYPGQSRVHYGDHPDYAGEVDHAELVAMLMRDFPDGWLLHTGARMLDAVLPLCPLGTRVLSWCKPLTAMKPGVSVDFGWEPIMLWGGRRRARRAPMIRDWIVCSPEQWTFRAKNGDETIIGMKPQTLCHWLFDCLGAREDDEMVDLFPGSGAVGRAWASYRAQPSLIAAAIWDGAQETLEL